MGLNPISYAISNNGYLTSSGYGKNAPSQSEDVVKSHFNRVDTVTLSPEGKEKASRSKVNTNGREFALVKDNYLNLQEIDQLQQLKLRDTEVRTHEQAHLSAAGQYARGGASYTYQKGPDGSSYAVAGEVNIDLAKESSPEATITKMQTIKHAALAPANPSGTDRRVAAQANLQETQARQELVSIQQEELLRGESSVQPPSGNQVTQESQNSEIIASTYGSLKSIIGSF
jgi:hypothetical protein